MVWHTQGSGKSLTMAFYAGRFIRQPATENPTIIVVTGRSDLDGRLLSVFSRCRDLLGQDPIQAQSRAELRELLPGPAVDALREWRRLQLEERMAAGSGWAGEEWVLTIDGRAVRPDAVTHWWGMTAKRAGVRLRLHDLRHLAATLMAQHGVPPRVIAEVLGHARASFTLDAYAGAPDIEALRAATETLARALERP